MTTVEEKENIRVGTKRGFQMEAVEKDNLAERVGGKKLKKRYDKMEPTTLKVEVAYLKRP